MKCLGTELATSPTDRTSGLSQRRFRLLLNGEVGSGAHPATCAVGTAVDALIIRLLLVARLRLSGGVPLLSGGVPLRSGGVPLRSGGVPLLSGGVPLRSGGVPLLHICVFMARTGRLFRRRVDKIAKSDC